MRADRLEQTVQVRQPIGLDARDVEPRPGHRHAAAARGCPGRLSVGTVLHTFGRRPRCTTVFSSPATEPGLAVPDVVEIAELERERRAWACVEHEMNVAGRAVRRGALVVVEEMEPDHVVDDLVPERRAVLDAGVDEVERGRQDPASRRKERNRDGCPTPLPRSRSRWTAAINLSMASGLSSRRCEDVSWARPRPRVVR